MTTSSTSPSTMPVPVPVPVPASTPSAAQPQPTRANAISTLASLPEELLANIAIKLGADDLASLRLSCKAVEAGVLYEFAKEYFEAKCFMFTTHSLQTLVNIAESEKLRPHLRHVYFITSSFSPRSLSCSHATCCCCWQPTTRQREAFIDYMRDQEKLRETNADRKLISNAFANLPGLRRVMLVDSLNSLADAPAECYCYGYNKVLRTTNKAPSFAPINETGYAEYFLWLSHVWQTVVGAVAESGIDSLTSFGTNFKSHTHGISATTDLRFKQHVLDKLTKAFAHLESFTIQMRSQYLRSRKHDTDKDISRAIKHSKVFGQVLQSAQSARFCFDYFDNSGSICKALTSSLELSQMTDVSFENLCIDGKAFALIVGALTSAEKLTFHAVDLTKGSWPGILKVVSKLPALEHLHLQFLQQAMQKVFFLPQPDDSEQVDGVPDSWLGLGTTQNDEDEDWTEEEENGSDDELPDLIPQNEVGYVPALEANPKDKEDSSTATPESEKKCPDYTGEDHKAPGRASEPERGYYVCLSSRAEIESQLPAFTQQCNLGDMFDQDMDIGNLFGMAGLPPNMAGGVVTIPAGPGGPGGNGPPAALNALVTQLNAMLGPGGPPPPNGAQAFTFPMPGNPYAVPTNQVPTTNNSANPPAASATTTTTAPNAQAGNTVPPASSHALHTNTTPIDVASSSGPPAQWMNDDDWINDVD